MAFMRKLANKLHDISCKNEEVSNFLESIPEWQEFYVNILTVVNALESKPLAGDPRKKQDDEDEYFDLLYKFKDVVNRSGFHNKHSKAAETETNDQDMNDRQDEEDEEDHDNQDRNYKGY